MTSAAPAIRVTRRGAGGQSSADFECSTTAPLGKAVSTEAGGQLCEELGEDVADGDGDGSGDGIKRTRVEEMSDDGKEDGHNNHEQDRL